MYGFYTFFSDLTKHLGMCCMALFTNSNYFISPCKEYPFKIIVFIYPILTKNVLKSF